MAEVFISYSRRDRPFVLELHKALPAEGRDVWVDLEDIPPTADWLNEVFAGIEGAAAVVFVLSPDAVVSKVCRDELAHAMAHNKRLVPIVCRDVDAGSVPPELASVNFPERSARQCQPWPSAPTIACWP